MFFDPYKRLLESIHAAVKNSGHATADVLVKIPRKDYALLKTNSTHFQYFGTVTLPGVQVLPADVEAAEVVTLAEYHNVEAAPVVEPTPAPAPAAKKPRRKKA